MSGVVHPWDRSRALQLLTAEFIGPDDNRPSSIPNQALGSRSLLPDDVHRMDEARKIPQ
jgi:hypothetical protein